MTRSPLLTNELQGALVADVLPARTRGIGLSVFSLAPFAGPALGPVVRPGVPMPALRR